MGRAAKREHLHRTLNSHAQSIRDTFHLLDQPADASLEKMDWSEVVKLGDEISKQATVCGMLSTGSTPEIREMEEHIGTYCNFLLGLLLLCQGSTVGAGPTLLACIRSSAEKVIDHSLSLMQEAVSSYGSLSSELKTSIPHLSGKVWESCAALKKSPVTNSMAIIRSLTKVGISIKDVLRELNELHPAAIGSDDAAVDSEDDEELSAEEMEIAKLGKEAVTRALVVVKESMRFVGDGVARVEVTEGILSKLEVVREKVDDLGACIFPPQEIAEMATAAAEMLPIAADIAAAAGGGNGSHSLVGALEVFADSLKRVVEVARRNEAGLERELGGLTL